MGAMVIFKGYRCRELVQNKDQFLKGGGGNIEGNQNTPNAPCHSYYSNIDCTWIDLHYKVCLKKFHMQNKLLSVEKIKYHNWLINSHIHLTLGVCARRYTSTVRYIQPPLRIIAALCQSFSLILFRWWDIEVLLIESFSLNSIRPVIP